MLRGSKSTSLVKDTIKQPMLSFWLFAGIDTMTSSFTTTEMRIENDKKLYIKPGLFSMKGQLREKFPNHNAYPQNNKNPNNKSLSRL